MNAEAPAPHSAGRARRVLVTTYGSLGDLHPYLALALELKARGCDVCVGTGACHGGKVRALGLDFHPIRPDSNWLDDPAAVRRMAHPRWGLYRALQYLFDNLAASYEDTLAAARGCDLLLGSLACYATSIAAEKLGLAWVSAMHIPSGYYSAYDPPLIPGFDGISRLCRPLGARFWGALGVVLKRGARRMGRPWHAVRANAGLPARRGVSPLVDSISPQLDLALFSSVLATPQRDWPKQTQLTGFPWFDAGADGADALPARLAEFLDDGSPPLVFTLGTAVSMTPGAFYAESIAAAQSLGRRAVLLARDTRGLSENFSKDIAVFPYAPFSKLLPRAAALVHHGGIGTTALALRAGCPALIVPCAWDQPDNAARATRLGVGRTLPRRAYTARRAASELGALLDNPAYTQRARAAAEALRNENGAAKACALIDAHVMRLPAPESSPMRAWNFSAEGAINS